MERGKEKMSMSMAIKDLFLQFHRRNNLKPEAIFFYRDGVSEGQFLEVLEHEYSEIKKVMPSIPFCGDVTDVVC